MYSSFLTYSDDGLHNAALTHLFQVKAANKPGRVSSLAALSTTSATCVSAAPDRETLFNFGSSVVRSMVAADISSVDGLIDTAWARMMKSGNYPVRYVNTYVELEQETRSFLDGRRGMAALSVADLKHILDCR